jgi:crotonobetainyl-CoA:carnitine CoA-transferase CaiB-like acyl-CoA transferase
MSRAFENIKVVDFSQVLAGPFATQQLAFLGANVIKVESRGVGEGGRHIRSRSDRSPENMSSVFLSVNAGKRSMTLDLKNPLAKDVVRRLAHDADVVIQNFKVGVIERLGFGYDEVRKFNPNVVYCSISGYGQVGPNAGAAAYDPAIQSASGMMQLVGTDASGPLRTGFPLVDMATGLTGAIAIMGALYRRKETGRGQFLDVAMMDSAMALLAFPYMQFQQTGEEPERLGNGSQLKTPTADVFSTSVGHIQITALTDKQVGALLQTLGLTALLEDPRFANADQRSTHRHEMHALLEAQFKQRPAREWEKMLAANGVPASAVLTLPETLAHEQLQHRNFLQHLTPTGSDQPIRLFNAAYGASEDGPEVALPPPAVGEHTDAILSEAGFSDDEIAGLRAAKVI